jgi:hypothetical protein
VRCATLSPAPELRRHIGACRHLSRLNAALRNACTARVGFIVDPARRARRHVDLRPSRPPAAVLVGHDAATGAVFGPAGREHE